MGRRARPIARRRPSFPTFLIGGGLLGAGLGGVSRTSDRVFLLRLSPPDQLGEFFGLYGIVGKFSAVTGPLLYGVIVSTLLDAGSGLGRVPGRGILSSRHDPDGSWLIRLVSCAAGSGEPPLEAG